VHTADEDEIRRLITRLGRPHPSGGTVVERAAIMAAGVDFGATIAWIVAHGGQPEARRVVAAGRGLHTRGRTAAGRDRRPRAVSCCPPMQ
jgi:hypothetical protein